MENKLFSYFNSTRAKSALVHVLCIAAVAGLGDLANDLTLFSVPPWLSVVLGVVIAQAVQGITGYVNQHPVQKGMA